jgi:hypothetical protein
MTRHIGCKTYIKTLCEVEHREVLATMSHEDFREFCAGFMPPYVQLSNGHAYQCCREMLDDALRRIAELTGALRYAREEGARIEAYADQLTDPEIAELAETGTWPAEPIIDRGRLA